MPVGSPMAATCTLVLKSPAMAFTFTGMVTLSPTRTPTFSVPAGRELVGAHRNIAVEAPHAPDIQVEGRRAGLRHLSGLRRAERGRHGDHAEVRRFGRDADGVDLARAEDREGVPGRNHELIAAV